MRSLRSFGNTCWVALAALLLPMTQSQAQSCVNSEGLNVCAIGQAQVQQLDANRVQLSNLGESGTDGASISLGQATDWTAAYETSSTSAAQRTTFTAVSDGAAISSTTSVKQGNAREISATFTGSGANSTYTLQAYRQGVLQAEVRGIQSGQSAAQVMPQQNGPPQCRPSDQLREDCIQACEQAGYEPCTYCDVRCWPRRVDFHNVRHEAATLGACRWVLSEPSTTVVLPNGNSVPADRVVMTEEVHAAGGYPYLSFERILFQASGGTAWLGHQTVTQSE